MAWSYQQIVEDQLECAQADRLAINADLERARCAEDLDGVREAAARMRENDAWFSSINNAVQNMQRQQQPPAQSYGELRPHQVQLAQKLGLTAAEAEHALASTGDKRIDDATRMQDYARGKQKREAWRATGAWDEVDVHNGYRR
jgi:hypothetical protein